MSIYITEANAQIAGNAGAIALALPAGASFKAANKGFIYGCWVRTPAGGYENAVTYGFMTRAGGGTSGADGFLRINQTCTTVTVQMRNAGADFIPLLTLTKASGDWQGKTIFVAVIATDVTHHVIVCEPGGTAERTSFTSGLGYAVNLAASDLISRLSAGTGAASTGHYGPIEEAFLILGLFPETTGVPDMTLLQNIASGAQDLATLDTLMTGTPVKKWRYRMLQQDMLTDAFGVAGALTGVNTSADNINLSCRPLRPIALTPDVCEATTSQIVAATLADPNTATTTIKIEGGAYTGSPFAIHSRLRKEDGAVLSGYDWAVADAAPAAGRWAASQRTGVPKTQGWLTVDFKAVDSGGSQIGDIVSGHWKSAGTNIQAEGQSQFARLFDAGSAIALPANIRLNVIDTNSGGPFRSKKPHILNTNSRITNGIRQLAIEINTLFPGVPITITSVAVSGASLVEWTTGGLYAALWANAKTFLGIVQPFLGVWVGHSNPDAAYESTLNNAIAKRNADFGTPICNLHELTPRYSGSSLNTAVQANRIGIWNRVKNNPLTDFIMTGISAVCKRDTSDVGPHDAANNVGQGRHGAGLAWGVMGKQGAKLVNDEPLTLVSVTRQNGGTEDVLNFGPVNP